MRRNLGKKLGVALVAGAALAAAWFTPGLRAASIPLVPSTSQYSEPSQIVATLNYLVGLINAGITQQSMAMPNTPRNQLDNGGMNVQQRGTGTATCANNGSAIASANYGPDRWGCEVNVGSGAGQLTPITATPSPPTGYQASAKLVRNSGALTQPQCAYQEIPSIKAQTLQAQNIVFSVNIQALAGLAGDQGSTTQTANLLIITGTGTDQGFGTWTASPALTPAWTNVATLINTSVALPVTPAWNRYQTTALVPSGVTEIAVAVCFTPTATGSGSTDGIAFTGAQLEPGTVASAFEFKTPGIDLVEAQKYYYELDETATIWVAGACKAESITVATCFVQFPVPMFKTPTMSYANGFATETTVAGGTLGACNTLATASTVASTAPFTNGILVGCTATTVPAAGSAGMLYSNNGTGKIRASADF